VSCVQVCTEWQTALTMISIYTHALQMFVNMVDSLAEEAGEPSAVSSSLNSIEKGCVIHQPAN